MLAQWILSELESDSKWAALFEDSQGKLASLANEARLNTPGAKREIWKTSNGMDSTTTRQFRDALAKLPKEVQDRAYESYALFKRDHSHPSLRFKKVHTTLPVYSARVTRDCRAVGIFKDNLIVWFWIGTHADYERVLASL